MDWERILHKSFLFVLLSTNLVTGTSVEKETHSIDERMASAEQAKCELEKAGLKHKNDSVQRTIGHDEYLDVRKIVSLRDQITPLPNSQYFDDAGFYAPAASNGWIFEKTTEVNLLQAVAKNGLEGQEMKLLRQVAGALPLYLWRSKRTLAVDHDPDIKSVFPFIAVEKVSVGEVKRVAEQATADVREPTAQCAGDIDGVLDSLFRGDVAGKLLTVILSEQAAWGDGQAELLNVQKIHNVVYISERMTLNDVTIDGVRYRHYFVYFETIIVSDGTFVTVVRTFVPSNDPFGNNEYSRFDSEWLANFRVLVG